jgi:hypothetical protein
MYTTLWNLNIMTTDPNNLLEPDSESRQEMAALTAGTTAPVETFIPDWGHYDGDYSANQAAQSWEHTDVDATNREYIIYGNAEEEEEE